MVIVKVVKTLYNQEYCVICGKYIGENNKMYCNNCEKEYFTEDKEDSFKCKIWDSDCRSWNTGYLQFIN